jgi:hypothetical protein
MCCESLIGELRRVLVYVELIHAVCKHLTESTHQLISRALSACSSELKYGLVLTICIRPLKM